MCTQILLGDKVYYGKCWKQKNERMKKKLSSFKAEVAIELF